MTSIILGALMILVSGTLIAASNYAASGFTLLLGTVFCIVGYERQVGWGNRIEHLCRGCFAVEKPARSRNNALRCSKWGSFDTVPIDSPFADAVIKQELEQLERVLQ